jgi:hypothetical protein
MASNYIYVLKNNYGNFRVIKTWLPLQIGSIIKMGVDTTQADGLMVWHIIV